MSARKLPRCNLFYLLVYYACLKATFASIIIVFNVILFSKKQWKVTDIRANVRSYFIFKISFSLYIITINIFGMNAGQLGIAL